MLASKEVGLQKTTTTSLHGGATEQVRGTGGLSEEGDVLQYLKSTSAP